MATDLDRLRKRYEPTTIPPCPICGEQLSLQAFGGGEPSRWACDGYAHDDDGEIVGRKPGRKITDEHYVASVFVDRRQGGDPDVIALIGEVRELRGALQADGAVSLDAILQECLLRRREREEARQMAVALKKELDAVWNFTSNDEKCRYLREHPDHFANYGHNLRDWAGEE